MAAGGSSFSGVFEVRYVVTMRRQAGSRVWEFEQEVVEFVKKTELMELLRKLDVDSEVNLTHVIHRLDGDGVERAVRLQEVDGG